MSVNNKNYFLAERKGRLKWLMHLLEKNPNTPFNKIAGILILRTGLKRKTIDTYVSELEQCGILEWNPDKRTYKVIQ